MTQAASSDHGSGTARKSISVDAQLDAVHPHLAYFVIFLPLAKQWQPGASWPNIDRDIFERFDYERTLDLNQLTADRDMLADVLRELRNRCADQDTYRNAVSSAWPDSTGAAAITKLNELGRAGHELVDAMRTLPAVIDAAHATISRAVTAKCDFMRGIDRPSSFTENEVKGHMEVMTGVGRSAEAKLLSRRFLDDVFVPHVIAQCQAFGEHMTLTRTTIAAALTSVATALGAVACDGFSVIGRADLSAVRSCQPTKPCESDESRQATSSGDRKLGTSQKPSGNQAGNAQSGRGGVRGSASSAAAGGGAASSGGNGGKSSAPQGSAGAGASHSSPRGGADASHLGKTSSAGAAPVARRSLGDGSLFGKPGLAPQSAHPVQQAVQPAPLGPAAMPATAAAPATAGASKTASPIHEALSKLLSEKAGAGRSGIAEGEHGKDEKESKGKEEKKIPAKDLPKPGCTKEFTIGDKTLEMSMDKDGKRINCVLSDSSSRQTHTLSVDKDGNLVFDEKPKGASATPTASAKPVPSGASAGPGPSPAASSGNVAASHSILPQSNSDTHGAVSPVPDPGARLAVDEPDVTVCVPPPPPQCVDNTTGAAASAGKPQLATMG